LFRRPCFVNLVSALIAHLSMGDGPDAVGPSAITSVLWGLSYFFLRRREVTLEGAGDAKRN